MKKHAISVVIPAYNEEKLICRCLESLSRQSYPYKELVVVDNDSSDNTARLARNYARVVFTRKRGPANAKNYGARHAKGDVIVFLDADCIAPQHLLRTIAKALDDGYDAGKMIRIKPDKDSMKARLLSIWWYVPNKIHQYTRIPIGGAGLCMFSRKRLFLDVGGFNEHVPVAEDADLTARLLKHGRFKFVEGIQVMTSMRRFEKEGYIYSNVFDMISVLFGIKRDDWVRI